MTLLPSVTFEEMLTDNQLLRDVAEGRRDINFDKGVMYPDWDTRHLDPEKDLIPKVTAVVIAFSDGFDVQFILIGSYLVRYTYHERDEPWYRGHRFESPQEAEAAFEKARELADLFEDE